jgi:hypothetical protein
MRVLRRRSSRSSKLGEIVAARRDGGDDVRSES